MWQSQVDNTTRTLNPVKMHLKWRNLCAFGQGRLWRCLDRILDLWVSGGVGARQWQDGCDWLGLCRRSQLDIQGITSSISLSRPKERLLPDGKHCPWPPSEKVWKSLLHLCCLSFKVIAYNLNNTIQQYHTNTAETIAVITISGCGLVISQKVEIRGSSALAGSTQASGYWGMRCLNCGTKA